MNNPLVQFVAGIGLVACGMGLFLLGIHAGIAMGQRDLRCGLGTIAVARPAPQLGQECLPLEVR